MQTYFFPSLSKFVFFVKICLFSESFVEKFLLKIRNQTRVKFFFTINAQVLNFKALEVDLERGGVGVDGKNTIFSICLNRHQLDHPQICLTFSKRRMLDVVAKRSDECLTRTLICKVNFNGWPKRSSFISSSSFTSSFFLWKAWIGSGMDVISFLRAFLRNWHPQRNRERECACER